MQTTLEKPRTSNVTVKLDGSERERLSSLALLKKRSTHYVMKEAIQAYLVREEAEQAEIQRAVKSLDHYKETGLHIKLDEFSTWVKAIRINPKTPMPVCHV
jgi:predicted transcriptional regulator